MSSSPFEVIPPERRAQAARSLLALLVGNGLMDRSGAVNRQHPLFIRNVTDLQMELGNISVDHATAKTGRQSQLSDIYNAIHGVVGLTRAHSTGDPAAVEERIVKAFQYLLELGGPPTEEAVPPVKQGLSFTGETHKRDVWVRLEEDWSEWKNRWWEKPKEATFKSANAHPRLVRAMTANKRLRKIRHPDGDDLDMDALVDVGATMPDPMPFDKKMNKVTVPDVLVLVDRSGSMNSSVGTSSPNMTYANVMATVIAKSALRAKCPFQVVSYEHCPDFDKAISWAPGRPYPKLPIRFRAGGGNDLMGSTIYAAEARWHGKPVRNSNRVVISICDGDLLSTGYVRDTYGFGCFRRRRPTSAESSAGHSTQSINAGFVAAIEDLSSLPKKLKAHAHCIAIGFRPEDWSRAEAKYPELFPQLVGAFSSVHQCPDVSKLAEVTSALAASILEHALQGA